MPEFARLGEDVFLRRKELEYEEFFLYGLIVLHSIPGADGIRICRLEIQSIIKIWELDYHNTMRRYKRLRKGNFSPMEKHKKVKKMQSPWVEQTTEGIIPLVGFKNAKATAFDEEQPVKITAPKNNKSSRDEKTNEHFSIFTPEEIKQYIEICQKRGDQIRNPAGLAVTLYRTGESDAFIEAALYPEPATQNEPELDEHGLPILDNEGLAKALEMLIKDINDGFDIEDYRKYYREEDWQWLMQEIQKSEAAKS